MISGECKENLDLNARNYSHLELIIFEGVNENIVDTISDNSSNKPVIVDDGFGNLFSGAIDILINKIEERISFKRLGL